MTPENLFNSLEGIKTAKTVGDALTASLDHIFVEEFPEGEERPCDKDDFSNFKCSHETNVTFLLKIINNLEKSDYCIDSESSTYVNTKLLASILVICGENAYHKPWNTEKTVRNCELILQKILKEFDCSDVTKLILLHKPKKQIKEILEILRPKLLAGVWKRHPAAVIAYKWILHFIEQPELSLHLSSVLPTALLLVDDFVNENRITGIECLTHIINNLTLAELQYHGHGEVIYSALLPLTRIREAEMVNAVIPCLILLTSKLETDIGKKQFAKWSKFDDILEIFLENMELETQIDLRDAYIKNLVLIMEVSTLEIVRWTKRLLRIFKEYLETGGKFSDDLTVNYCFKAVTTFMNITESARTVYAKDLLFVLMSALYYLVKEETEMQKENKKNILALIQQLNVLTESDKEELKAAFCERSFRNIEYRNVILEILDSK